MTPAILTVHMLLLLLILYLLLAEHCAQCQNLCYSLLEQNQRIHAASTVILAFLGIFSDKSDGATFSARPLPVLFMHSKSSLAQMRVLIVSLAR